MGSTASSLLHTAILVRLPASRAMDFTSTMPSKISGTSSSNSRFTSPGWVREISTWGPRVLRRTSTTYTFTCWPSTSSSVRICSLEASMASVDSGPVPMRRETFPVRGSIRLTTPVRISCCLELNSS